MTFHLQTFCISHKGSNVHSKQNLHINWKL